jgi:hypothetical protein
MPLVSIEEGLEYWRIVIQQRQLPLPVPATPAIQLVLQKQGLAVYTTVAPSCSIARDIQRVD